MLPKPAGGGGLLSRLHAWWEGYDDDHDLDAPTLGVPGASVEGDNDDLKPDAEDSAVGEDRTPRLWTPERIAAVQMVCGEGCSTPGGTAFATSAIKPLGLNETMSVLVYGAQLGYFARVIARETGAWVDGLEPDPLLAEEAIRLSQVNNLSKKAAIQAGDLASANLKDGSRDAVIAVEALHRLPDREGQIAGVNRLLKPGGQLLVVEFVSKNAKADTPAIDAWKAYEPVPPEICTADALRKALKRQQLNVRVTADITPEYVGKLTHGLQGMAKQLIKHPPESAMHTALLREVHYWGRRLSVLQSGDVGMVRMMASRPKD